MDAIGFPFYFSKRHGHFGAVHWNLFRHVNNIILAWLGVSLLLEQHLKRVGKRIIELGPARDTPTDLFLSFRNRLHH